MFNAIHQMAFNIKQPFTFLDPSSHPQPLCFGGADRDRTGDPLLAKQVLSQLSYSPSFKWWAWVDSNYRPHPYQGCALAT
jgi:hypothetical protein